MIGYRLVGGVVHHYGPGTQIRERPHCDAGGAILLVSSELDEILALADRVMVMNAGHVVGELPIEQCSEQALGRLMGGLH